MAFSFSLRLLESHRHEIFVGLGLGGVLRVGRRRLLELPLKIFNAGTESIAVAVVNVVGLARAKVTIRYCARIEMHFFKFFVALE